jgi:hypothetical protein
MISAWRKYISERDEQRRQEADGRKQVAESSLSTI